MTLKILKKKTITSCSFVQISKSKQGSGVILAYEKLQNAFCHSKGTQTKQPENKFC